MASDEEDCGKSRFSMTKTIKMMDRTAKISLHITQTCPCNIQRFFTAVKMKKLR